MTRIMTNEKKILLSENKSELKKVWEVKCKHE